MLTKWVKLKPINRIIVVSDAVANDEVQKTLILSVSPANVKASAVGVDKMVRRFIHHDIPTKQQCYFLKVPKTF